MNISPNSLLSLLKEFKSNTNKINVKNSFSTPDFVHFLSVRGITIKDNQISASSHNKIILALAAVECGADVLAVCKLIDWRDFELFASEIMRYHNYVVYKNYRIKNPTRQIDIVGIRLQNALIVDCKHWKRISYSGLVAAVNKQKERGILFMEKNVSFEIEFLYPIIITFLPCEFRYVNQVPVIPINFFNSFLIDFDNYKQNLFRI